MSISRGPETEQQRQNQAAFDRYYAIGFTYLGDPIIVCRECGHRWGYHEPDCKTAERYQLPRI